LYLLYNMNEDKTSMSNPNKINKDQLLDAIAKRANVGRKEVADVIDALEKVVIDAMKQGKEAVLTGFGSFLARTRESRMGVNPQNPTQRIKIPTVTVPKFKAGKTLKDALKGKEEPEESPSEPEAQEPVEPEVAPEQDAQQ